MVWVIYARSGVSVLNSVSTSYRVHVPSTFQPTALTIVSWYYDQFWSLGASQMVQILRHKNETLIRKAALVTTTFAAVLKDFPRIWWISAHVFFSPEKLPKTANGSINFDLIVRTILTTYLPSVLLALILLFGPFGVHVYSIVPGAGLLFLH